MDKRTVVFILLVGIVFFGLNLFFSQKRDQNNRDLIQSKEAQKKKEQTAKWADIERRTAKLQDLPIVEISLAPGKGEAVAGGINVGGSTLTLAWENSMPQTIYVNGSPQSRLTVHPVKGGPVVYAQPDFQYFDITSIPDIGAYDVQLITFPPNMRPRIFLGEVENGTLSIPAGPFEENALALYKTSNGWLPAGFYEAQGNIFIDLQNLPLTSEFVQKSGVQGKVSPSAEKKQKYFVLENAYTQLVFSNVGGALVEINLPFKSDSHPESVVKEIGFDRTLASDYPNNARFPAHPYYKADSKEEHAPGPVGGYYPLLRRGVWNKTAIEISPKFYALNLVSDYPEMAELMYEVKEFTPTKIVFEGVQAHRKITKTFTLSPGAKGAPYIFDLSVQIEGDTRGLWLTSGVPEVEIMSNSSSPQIQYRVNRKGKADVEKLDLPKAKEVVSVSSVYPDWVVNSNGYLGIIMDPLSEIGAGYKANAILGSNDPTRLSVIDPKYHPYPASKYPGYEILLPFPQRGGSAEFRIYSGPFEESVLKAVDKIYSDPDTGYNPDYIACRTFYGWFSFISEPFAKLLFIVMKLISNEKYGCLPLE